MLTPVTWFPDQPICTHSRLLGTFRGHLVALSIHLQQSIASPLLGILPGDLVALIIYLQKIIDNGYGYEANGSVYFDVKKYAEKYNYGELSGRKIDELMEQTREDLEGGDEKRFFADFAIWKAASPETI